MAKKIAAHFFPRFTFSGFRNHPQMPKKPDPARALSILADLNLSPHQCLYLGDSEVDIMTAKNAGFLPVGASWGSGSGGSDPGRSRKHHS